MGRIWILSGERVLMPQGLTMLVRGVGFGPARNLGRGERHLWMSRGLRGKQVGVGKEGAGTCAGGSGAGSRSRAKPASRQPSRSDDLLVPWNHRPKRELSRRPERESEHSRQRGSGMRPWGPSHVARHASIWRRSATRRDASLLAGGAVPMGTQRSRARQRIQAGLPEAQSAGINRHGVENERVLR